MYERQTKAKDKYQHSNLFCYLLGFDPTCKCIMAPKQSAVTKAPKAAKPVKAVKAVKAVKSVDDVPKASKRTPTQHRVDLLKEVLATLEAGNAAAARKQLEKLIKKMTPNPAKRAPTAYNLFLKERYAADKAADSSIKLNAKMKEYPGMWAALSEDEKAKYVAEAAALKASMSTTTTDDHGTTDDDSVESKASKAVKPKAAKAVKPKAAKAVKPEPVKTKKAPEPVEDSESEEEDEPEREIDVDSDSESEDGDVTDCSDDEE